MRMITTTLLYALTVSATALAAPAPRLIVDRPVYDFATITQGKKATHVFVLKNKGTAPLKIRKTRTKCGCTAVSSSSDEVMPGKSIEVMATFDSTGYSGSVTKEVIVESNDPQNPEYTLTLKGTVAEKINISPGRADFGSVRGGTAKELVLTVENRGEKNLRLKEVVSSLSQVTARLSRGTLRPGESGGIILKAAPGKDDRLLSGFIRLETDSPSKPMILISVYGSVVK